MSHCWPALWKLAAAPSTSAWPFLDQTSVNCESRSLGCFSQAWYPRPTSPHSLWLLVWHSLERWLGHSLRTTFPQPSRIFPEGKPSLCFSSLGINAFSENLVTCKRTSGKTQLLQVAWDSLIWKLEINFRRPLTQGNPRELQFSILQWRAAHANGPRK